MMRQIVAGLTLILLVMLGWAPVARARGAGAGAGPSGFIVQGTILQVDPVTGVLLLRDDAGQIVGAPDPLSWGRVFNGVRPPVLLKGLQPGDRVEVRGIGFDGMFIRRLPPLPSPLHPGAGSPVLPY
jgi:hypothetical protein